mmetsp:Transcript_32143/g.77030  ORF Transcript_32143/g.77030 Transcript_32143/m.77030 type:complete len:241 (+) Transcript_32143:205-927(+)
MEDPQSGCSSAILSSRGCIVAVPQVVVDREIPFVPLHLYPDSVHEGVKLLRELFLHDRVGDHALWLALGGVWLITVDQPASAERRAAVEHEGGVATDRVLVHHGVGVLPSSRDHPQLVPPVLRLVILSLVQLLQRDKPRLPTLTDSMEVHGLVLERRRLKRTVHVPPRATDPSASFLLIVGHPEDVRVGAGRVLVECALHLTQLLGDGHLALPCHLPLAFEQQHPVLLDVILYSCHQGWG